MDARQPNPNLQRNAAPVPKPPPSPTLFVDTQFVSPYALSAFVALTEKRVPFELQRVDLASQQNQQQPFQQLSLTARVPTLEYDGFSLSESSAIVEFIEEEFAPPRFRTVLPVDRRQRARARQMQAWLRSDLMALRAERPTTVFFAAEPPPPLTSAGKDAAGKLLRVAASLLRDGSQDLFGGWSIADTDLAVMLNRLVAAGDRVPAPVRSYVERQWARPSLQKWRELVRV